MTDGDGEAACELTLQATGAWDHPLTRKDKMQRLLQLFEQELQDREHELVIARMQISAEEPRGEGGAEEEKVGEEKEVEANVALGGGGSCTIRGTPDHVATVLKALGGKFAPADVAPASRRASWVSCRASSQSSSSGASTPRSAVSSPRGNDADQVTASRFSFGPLATTSSAATLRPQGLPGLQLRGLNDAQGRLSARPADSTPLGPVECSTPGRAFGLGTPRAAPFVATPRSSSRVWSLVTPRGLSPLPARGLDGSAGPAGSCGVLLAKPRTPVVPVLQGLREENNAEHDGEAEEEAKSNAASTDRVSEVDEGSVVNLEVSFAELDTVASENQAAQPAQPEPQQESTEPACGGIDVLGMDDATRFAALGSMPAEQRTAVLEAMRLWAEAAAELQQPAPHPGRQNAHAVRREVRKEKLRPWRVAPKGRPLRAEMSASRVGSQAEEAGDAAADAVVWARNGFLSLREKSLGAKAEVANAAARLRQGVVSATASASVARTSAAGAAASSP